ncbi:RHS repeat-associated core domain-containing protein [Clostridium sp. DMHC 10]|uniref:RHS repeat-associated core domain-containing protein n=1 Tax=Clostridium sp. DMHC 10 TaxID=747377 RepID=UPI000A050A9F|nr:RHS repeat-associated core domain-containing protein [Clostridium sp. DMHC 10]
MLPHSTGTQVVSYTYDTWGKLISIGGSLKDTVGVLNPYRYRGYRYDTETGLYYLQSRYYNPEWGRFINADDTDQLDDTNEDLLDYNMFAYCNNNSVNKADNDGRFAYALYFVPGIGGVVLGITIGVVLVYGAYKGISYVRSKVGRISFAKTKSNSDPYARPNQKKQGRERKEQKRKKPNWKNNPNRRAKPLPKHTPGKTHRKY